MKVAILGTGYVGLVSGVCLAARGHDVTCFDIDTAVVERLNRGDAHIYEKDLGSLLASVLRDGRFRASLASVEALKDHSTILVAVGTPSTDGRIDLRFVGDAAAVLGQHVASSSSFVSIIVKSTVLPGTTDTFVKEIVDRHAAGRSYGLGMNPEFLREGEAISDFMDPDRIVLGYEDLTTLERLRELYAPWDCTKLEVNSRTAEMIKYANNCLLATQISAINELANVAGTMGGIDVRAMLEGVHSDRRWNPIDSAGTRANPGILRYLIPGSGFGGSCFPKDVQAMRSFGRSLDLPMQLLQAVLDVNDRQPREAVKLLEQQLGSLAGKRLLVLGLAFKSGTDDVRESPAIRLIQALSEAGAHVIAHDPMATHTAAPKLPKGVEVVDDWSREIAASDGVVLATSWPEYSALRSADHLRLLARKPLIDTRLMFSQADFPGIEYRAIGGTGRPTGAPA